MEMLEIGKVVVFGSPTLQKSPIWPSLSPHRASFSRFIAHRASFPLSFLPAPVLSSPLLSNSLFLLIFSPSFFSFPFFTLSPVVLSEPVRHFVSALRWLALTGRRRADSGQLWASDYRINFLRRQISAPAAAVLVTAAVVAAAAAAATVVVAVATCLQPLPPREIAPPPPPAAG